MNPGENNLYIVDGFPIPICHFARAKKGKLFKREAGYGRCPSKEQVYFRFKGSSFDHSNGLTTSFLLTPANIEVHSKGLTRGFKELIIGDKGFISQSLKDRLKFRGIDLQTPLKKNMKNTRDSKFVVKIKSIRRLVETVIGQFNDRLNIARIRVKDTWHLVACLSRKTLTHTIGVFLNKQLNRPFIKFDDLLTI
jgi:hypothetical protein